MRAYYVRSSAELVVSVIDWGDKVAGVDPDVLLEGGKQGGLKSTNSHLIGERKLSLNGYRGLEVESENDRNYSLKRMYMVGTTLYALIVTSSREKRYADTARFLDSFELIPRTRKGE
jgi:hypothetical protein